MTSLNAAKPPLYELRSNIAQGNLQRQVYLAWLRFWLEKLNYGFFSLVSLVKKPSIFCSAFRWLKKNWIPSSYIQNWTKFTSKVHILVRFDTTLLFIIIIYYTKVFSKHLSSPIIMNPLIFEMQYYLHKESFLIFNMYCIF